MAKKAAPLDDLSKTVEGQTIIDEMIGGNPPNEPSETHVSDVPDTHSIASFLDSMASDSPEPSANREAPPIVSQPSPTNTSSIPAMPVSSAKDRAGQLFDATKHATKADGTPAFRADGTFRARRGTGSQSRISRNSIPAQSTAPQTVGGLTADQIARARMLGTTFANALVGIAARVGGEEWNPVKEPVDEKAELESAFANYCQAKGMTDMSPGFALTLAVSAYALPRFLLPKTREKVSGVWDWTKSKWRNIRAARANSRNDGKRKDNASEKTSGGEESSGEGRTGVGPFTGPMGRFLPDGRPI